MQSQVEQQLIDQIKSKANHQVFPHRFGGGVMVVITRPNGVRQQSISLGRKLSVSILQEILAA